MTSDPGEQATTHPQPYSDYRRLAAEARSRINEPRPEGICEGEWAALCNGTADHWDKLAEQHEQAIAEGRAYEFLYGDDQPPEAKQG